MHYDVTVVAQCSDETVNSSYLFENVDLNTYLKDNSISNKLYKVFVLGSLNQTFSKEFVREILNIVANETFCYMVVDHLRMYCVYNKNPRYILLKVSFTGLLSFEVNPYNVWLAILGN